MTAAATKAVLPRVELGMETNDFVEVRPGVFILRDYKADSQPVTLDRLQSLIRTLIAALLHSEREQARRHE